MLPACASSRSEPPAAAAADPVIETRTVVEKVCPEELRLAAPERPDPAPDARIEGNDSGMAWLRDMMGWAGLIEARLADAKKDCE